MRKCDLWLHLGGTVVDPATCSDLVVLKLILIIEVHERYYLVAANWKYFYTRSCSQDEVMCTTALIRIGQRNLACRCGMVNSLGEANTQWDLELVVSHGIIVLCLRPYCSSVRGVDPLADTKGFLTVLIEELVEREATGTTLHNRGLVYCYS